MFVIEDEAHGEPGSAFATKEEALAELQRLAALPWDHPPNRAPCTSWETCGRRYICTEYDDRCMPWRIISRVPVLDVSNNGVKWYS